MQFVLARDGRGAFDFASLQGEAAARELARLGRPHDPTRLSTFYVIADYRSARPRLLDRGRASLFVWGALGWPWRAATVFGVLPATWLDRAYDAVAANRLRVFGRADACVLPTPATRRRFLDLS